MLLIEDCRAAPVTKALISPKAGKSAGGSVDGAVVSVAVDWAGGWIGGSAGAGTGAGGTWSLGGGTEVVGAGVELEGEVDAAGGAAGFGYRSMKTSPGSVSALPLTHQR